ncbi:hypothetical protein [Paraconexibacter algicola]|uniref:hypothetical protein n=1 Tax=Paraconexibacter algicola TaxID=2133960 RepID=UPI001304BD50|nr:hypothetical protein [Paraconexibacter algicola]
MSRITTATRRRALPAAALVAGGLGALTAPVVAHGAAEPRRVPGAGFGLAVTTEGPDLVGAAIDAPDLRRVRYCFDQPLNGSPAAGDFLVQTYDALRFMRGTSATVDPANQACALVTFAATANLAEGTVAQVQATAVRDAANRTNPPASEPLGGSSAKPVAGATTAPDLTAADASDTAAGTGADGPDNGNAPDAYSGGTILFTFDEDLAPGSITAGRFVFFDDAGTARPGAVIKTRPGDQIGRNQVRIGFNSPVSSATRIVARASAATDQPQSGAFGGASLATPSSLGAIATASASASPVVTAVSGGPKSFTVTYDRAVKNAAAAKFAAVIDDGRTFTASGAAVNTDGRSVTVTMPDAIGDEAAAVVRFVDEGGAVAANDSTGRGSEAGQTVIGTANNQPGLTNGPDLLAVARNPTTNQVVFRFDEPVKTATASRFSGITGAGTSLTPSGAASVEGPVVTVGFGQEIATSVGAGGVLGAAVDSQGHPSPFTSVSYAVAAAPPAGTTPPASSTRERVRTGFASFKRSPSRRAWVSGRLSASARTCKVNRRVVLRRVGKGTTRYGSATTRSDGTFTFKRSTRLSGRLYAVVTAKTTSTTICGSRTSKTIR